MGFFKVFTIDDQIEDWGELTDNQKLNLDRRIEDFLSSQTNKKYYISKQDENHRLNTLNQLERTNTQSLEGISFNFATDLLNAETIEDDKKIRRNKNIKNGIFIFKVTNNETIFLKLEEISTINRDDFSRDTSLGGDKEYFKLAQVFFNSNDSDDIIKVNIVDAHEQIAKYWSEKFLKLKAINTDEQNTKSLTKAIKSNEFLNEISEVNIDILEKTTNEFLHQQNSFSFSRLTDFLNSKLNLDKSHTEYFQNSVFDKIDDEFQFDLNIIRKHFGRNIKVNNQITLKINDAYEAAEGGMISLNNTNNKVIIELDDRTDFLNKFPELREMIDY
ncbi:hypothetical protein [Staphylococcus epidermidis]|uniref:hypothetical protein n=1 Tax=Staphylococcus epidermidis TaxID=1282 RepID=UPI001A9F664D|nr:hypothetical protein [Staphylococcus epidermidis]MBO1577817.1 hypothetical protein [Staphylococcus epidermidis]